MGYYDALFQPLKIGTMEIKNRIVMTAMGANLMGLLIISGRL